ncbi:DUF507 family protein [Sulfurimonas paralvinellae]|uniref:DUF507 family protein n=1 Tax=Sulfurimonas paralvinellae TaxID=317658 RepID=A0A7M1B9U9_9BACT|nr:DUF507 family protein [Sulfurimonas paralvinellae]QOP46509.1 DUF507 family protein [Sulfurimonas paralvinellae]
MKVSLKTIPHISNKIAIDLNKSGVVTMTKGLEPVAAEAQKIFEENIKKEMALEEKVNDYLEENEEEIEFMLADERQLFFMIKKKLAPQYDVILDYEERFSDIAHKILDELYEEDLIHFDVTENRIKNIIYNAITSFLADTSEIEDAVMDKIRSYKRKFIPGTDEFEILHEKLYREELMKRGME